ncbi:dihydrouridine synthase 4 [Rhynchophorus ferrugineus]|uniref:DUS-like FMN-binding domain-containing protein n=1 Tax=Rhynchophorus ferrugineus TaxID=354439 RepID=A0A834HST1_RHYFE|nr:hypothetical protein GWI33_020253 [Rhynchophorus ferrugineus]
MELKAQFDILELFETKDLVKICAPMVRYSKLQFRNLVKLYDCDLVFSPMILADSICKSEKARNNEFTTNSADTPLVIQFAANTVHDFVGASYLVAPHCNGVDLNCGCPQRWARDMNVGCEMLKNPQVIYDLVRQCRNTINKPFSVSVKTRIMKDLNKTIDIARQLEHSGVSFLTVHSRTLDENTGPINEDALQLISKSVKIPIVGNGGLSNLDDCSALQEKTNIRGVMVANGILTNPEIFTGVDKTSLQCVQKWLDICYNSTLTISEYNNLINKKTTLNVNIPEKPYNLTFQCFHHHLVFMMEKILTRRQKRVFNNLKKFKDVLFFLEDNFNIRPRIFNNETFLKYNIIDIDYSDREKMYNTLKEFEIPEYTKCEYNSLNSDGKYFTSKLEEADCDWCDIFND